MNIFLNSLADNKKWDSINKHLILMKNNVKDIVTNINMLNLGKAFKFNETLKMLSSKDSNQNLSEVIKALKEMIGLLYEQAKLNANTGTNNNNVAGQTIVNPIIDKNGKSLVSPQQEAINKQLADEEREKNTLAHFVEALEAATLKVEFADQTTNKFFGR